MPAKTIHVFPKDDGWAVKKEGDNGHRAYEPQSERRRSAGARRGAGGASRSSGGDVLLVKQDGQRAVKKPHPERANAMLPAAVIERAKQLAGRGQGRDTAKRDPSVYFTQKQAIEAAREIAQRSSAGQIVVHARDGSMRWRDVHGLPPVQTPPRKSDLGTKAIEKAVSTVIRERLAGK